MENLPLRWNHEAGKVIKLQTDVKDWKNSPGSLVIKTAQDCSSDDRIQFLAHTSSKNIQDRTEPGRNEHCLLFSAM